jgi:hypothetical protein
VRGLGGWIIVAATVAVLSIASLVAEVAGAGAKPAFAASTPPPNACGCYRDSSGSCFCGKKGKCACPGDCEPKGCDEKRARQLDKEIAAETKKAAAASNATGGSKAATSHKGADEGDGENDGDDGKTKSKPAHLTVAQKKELLRLLDAYLSEHPEGKSQTVPEVRAAVGGR